MSIKKRLAETNIYTFAIYSALVTFLLYTCCYAFRKPFTVGLYEDEFLWGIDVKLLYVMSEILGYACSKIVGTYLLPSVQKHQRIYYIAGLLIFSELAWLGFGFMPPSMKLVCTFLSGLPLGMIWGLVFSFIEGRRISEVLNVGLSVAVIVASGMVKTLGQSLMNTFGITEYWMPFATGAVALPFVMLCCYLLNQIPEPNDRDKIQRSERLPMTNSEKKNFIKQFSLGIVLLFLLFGSLTVFREVRDSFAADVWAEYNITDSLIFTKSEFPIAVVVLVLMTSIVFVYNNRKALRIMYVIAVLGAIITISSTLAFMNNMLDPVWWMILMGLGMYMSYTIFTYFIDRLIGALRLTSTAVFMIYLIDSFGYMGTASVFAIKNFSSVAISWTTILIYLSLVSSIICIVTIVSLYFYFNKKIKAVESGNPIIL